MRIKSPASLEAIRHFMQGADAITHCMIMPDKTVECFSISKCDHCETMCRDANPITFDNVPLPGLFAIAGLEPCTITDELGATDGGDACCPECWNNAQLEA